MKAENYSQTDFNINTKGKGLVLVLATVSLIIMMVLTTLLWWFISPRLHEISDVLATLSLTALRIFYLVLTMGMLLVYLTCYLGRNFLIAHFAVRSFITVLFPISVFFGKIVGISEERLRTSFVHVNNAFLQSIRKRYPADRILILLPHCLQHTSCKIRITIDIHLCARCGRCDISRLVDIADKYHAKIAIATGGTLARRIVLKYRPKMIIAVACQRDLVDGLRDVFPIPVYGVLNDRPEGPCINTRVATKKIEYALQALSIHEST